MWEEGKRWREKKLITGIYNKGVKWRRERGREGQGGGGNFKEGKYELED